MNERTWDEKINEKGKEAACLSIRMKRKTAASPMRDLNSRPLVYETSALTTELTRLIHWLSK